MSYFSRFRRLVPVVVVVSLMASAGQSLAAGLSLPSASALPTVAGNPAPGSVQSFLDRQPGVLKSHREGKYTAAQLIEGYAAYYSLNPHVILTLLETTNQLITTPKPAQTALERPFGLVGPTGFGAQIDWATREVRAGFGPYSQDPVVQFSDGKTATIDRKQEPVSVAVQRFLATGHTEAEWHALVTNYGELYRRFFGDEPQAPTPTATPTATHGFLSLPWIPGTRMIHSSYFDHVYPTVDRGSDGNTFIVNYLGKSNLSYNTHDGHDYYFPDKPIGTTILAAAPGIAYALTTRGNGVVIRHTGAYAGYETVYWHLDQFDIKFQNKIDTQIGVPVQAGDVLGVSGKSGFTDGGAHLHFEVRHNGRQVDPYGWYGGGSDPCAAWAAGCEASVWLWNDSLRGTYDFTSPDAPAMPVIDRERPVGTLGVRQDGGPSLLLHFDGHPVATLGAGFPEVTAANGAGVIYTEGVFGKAAVVPQDASMTYQTSGNLDTAAGTIAVWANIPAEYPKTKTNRRYLLATSENPEDGEHGVYANTLALRRQVGDNGPEWNFWTVDDAGKYDNLVISDTLQPGWHHFAITWNRADQTKRLVVDGVAVSRTGAALPATMGERLEIGHWTVGYGAWGGAIDELAAWPRALNVADVVVLATKRDVNSQAVGPVDEVPVVHSRDIVLDTNAIDAQGGIVNVEIKRDDEGWSEPLPYYDSFRWRIEGPEGLHTFVVRYRDRANNTVEVATTVRLATPPSATAQMITNDGLRATLALTVTSEYLPLMQQVSSAADFAGAAWEPLTTQKTWLWIPGAPRIVYVRFRDANGLLSQPLVLGPGLHAVYEPLVFR